MLELAFAAGG
ncbi:hypothetical protein YPPY45_2052, partial [Yersinia pestis PY-45]